MILTSSIKRITVILTILALPLIAFAGSTEEPKKEKLIRVEAKKVCMVNDKLFEKDQIPVKVDGRTYYGCCEMCKKTLAERAEFRVAADPVSGKEVDKANAVIGAKPDGTTLYFESEKNLEEFNSKSKN